MNEKTIRIIIEAAQKVTPIKLTGHRTAQLFLTPPVVKKISRYEGGYRSSGFFVPRCEFKVNPSINSAPLAIGIYQGGLNLPEFCCVCMQPVNRYELVQLGKSKEGAYGSLQLPFTDQEQAELIADAYYLDRFWYAIPFCKMHDLGSKGISLKEKDDHFVFGFTNRDYGKLFGELNKIEGKWINKSTITARILFKFRLVISFFAILVGGLLTLANFLKSVTPPQPGDENVPSLFLSLLILLAGIGVFGWSLFFWIKHRKGEDLYLSTETSQKSTSEQGIKSIEEFCPRCKYFTSPEGICLYLNEKILGNPLKFSLKCNGKYFVSKSE